MAILNFSISRVGEVGITPRFIYFDTNDTPATVETVGYLNKFVAAGNVIAESDIAVVATRATPGARQVDVELFNVTFSNGNWSLTANSSELSLPNDNIFVGNASDVAVPVVMSGDATLSNTGVLTVANDAITLAKLAPGVKPAYIVALAGTFDFAGGAASFTINSTGSLASDLAFVQIQASTNAVSVQKVLPGLNTINVTVSADPGAATVAMWQILRAAS